MHFRSSLPLLAGLIIATGALAAAPASATTGAARAGSATAAANPQPGDPLPECRYADVKTRYRSTADWQYSLVDTERKESRAYVPPDLVSVNQAHVAGTGSVRSQVIADLQAMAKAARRAGAAFAVRSAYRSYSYQERVFKAEIARYGYEQALRQSARAGHSEHQLGTALDLRSAGSTKAPWDYKDWGMTAAGVWLAENAYRFGFVMSYPAGGSAESCYIYEPWHFRYFGRDLASAIHASGQVPRRYLWEHFETAA